MRIKVCLFMVGFVLYGYADSVPPPIPPAQVTFRVIDDAGKPVQGAAVLVSWKDLLPQADYPVIIDAPKEGATDGRGLYVATGRAMPFIDYSARKEGYYSSEGKYWFADTADGKKIPWNPTIEMVLRPIENPIPMYTKAYADFVLPVAEVGYDFIKGDFVAPHGRGEVADCIITRLGGEGGIRKKAGHWREQNWSITFPGDFNGVVPIPTNTLVFSSEFIWPRHAFDASYSEKTITYLYRYDQTEKPGADGSYNAELITRTPDTFYFFFRIRSEKNADGSFKSAFYGKLRAIEEVERSFYFNETNRKKYAIKRFSFYVNPTRNDLNMEYDAKRNRNLSYSLRREDGKSGRWHIAPKAYKKGEMEVMIP